MKKYNPKKIEKKWQKNWQEKKIHKTNSNKKGKKGNFYLLDMFPYPSGEGFHMGHLESYTISDVFYRYKKMQGFNVLHPQGLDSFGLPAENYAIKTGTHPKKTTQKNSKNFLRQWTEIGSGHDLENILITSNPEYYKWTQWLFGEFFKNNLTQRKKEKTNWCPSCKTIISNEQVESGKCERCKSEILQKEIFSWFFKITDFSDALIKDLEKVDWPEHTKKNQTNWIGKKEGAEIEFSVIEKDFVDINNDGGKDSYKKGVKEVERDNVVVIVEHPKEDKFLCLKWKKVDWQGFVTGGIEDGQTAKQTAEQEVIEETGYQNPEVVKVYNNFSHGKFFHVGKKVNRFAHYQIVHVKLKNLKRKERNEEEKEIADFFWTDKKKVESFLKREDMKYPWRVFNNKNFLKEKIKTFTTRADTLYGVTYLVLAPENNFIKNIWDRIEKKKEVEKYQEKTFKKTEKQRLENKEKTGVKIEGVFAENPATKEKIPIFISDYVLGGYGTGSVMAVPAHDQRDFDFAKKFNLEIKNVVSKNNKEKEIKEDVFQGEGILKNSEEFSGMDSEKAREKIIKKFGKKKNTYRLRDWSVSRQRYWGTPIPIVYSPKGEPKFVGEKNLPWLLPEDVDFKPDGTAPLEKSKELKKRTEKIFGKGWKPETETMDTFVDSAWYFLRHPDSKNKKEFCSEKMKKFWIPKGVDLYIGGAEHTYMHLLYARFFVKALKKIGHLNFSEPFLKLRHQGFVCDESGKKMSKSKGNVVNPDDVIKKFGADAARVYMMFAAPVEDDVIWKEESVVGAYRFLEKVWKIGEYLEKKSSKEVEKNLHKLIKKVSSQIEDLKYNTAISDMMKFINVLEKEKEISKKDFSSFLKLLHPFAPHVCEELYNEKIEKKNILLTPWPKYDEKKTEEENFFLVVQVLGKKRAGIEISKSKNQKEIESICLKNPEVKKWIEGKKIKKIIYVPEKILNIVV